MSCGEGRPTDACACLARYNMCCSHTRTQVPHPPPHGTIEPKGRGMHACMPCLYCLYIILLPPFIAPHLHRETANKLKNKQTRVLRRVFASCATVLLSHSLLHICTNKHALQALAHDHVQVPVRSCASACPCPRKTIPRTTFAPDELGQNT